MAKRIAQNLIDTTYTENMCQKTLTLSVIYLMRSDRSIDSKLHTERVDISKGKCSIHSDN